MLSMRKGKKRREKFDQKEMEEPINRGLDEQICVVKQYKKKTENEEPSIIKKNTENETSRWDSISMAFSAIGDSKCVGGHFLQGQRIGAY